MRVPSKVMRVLAALALVLGAVACAPSPAARPSALHYDLPELRQFLPQRPPAPATLAPGMPMRQAVLARATEMLGIPYLWGGNSIDGLDCSAYVSTAWFTARRQTTDTLVYVATMVDKEALLPGDVLNLETWEHPTHAGHVRIFAAWADEARTRMWVFEETYPIGAVYHVVTYDHRYTPLRYDPLSSETGTATLIVPRVQN